MRQRCSNENDRAYKNYGGRGIKVCDEWNEYLPFRIWSYESGYKRGLTIDRIDNDGHYEPDNCRWVGRNTQNTNKRQRTRILTLNGVTKSMKEWAREMGHPDTRYIRRRLYDGWSIQRAVEQPVLPQGKAR